MEEVDKGCPMIRMGVSGWVFLLVPLNGCVCVCVFVTWQKIRRKSRRVINWSAVHWMLYYLGEPSWHQSNVLVKCHFVAWYCCISSLHKIWMSTLSCEINFPADIKNNILMTVFMMLSLWLKVTARVHAVHLVNAAWVPLGRQPSLSWGCESTVIHHRHLLVLLSPKADTHFCDRAIVHQPTVLYCPRWLYMSSCCSM